jgi:hypothetical protein
MPGSLNGKPRFEMKKKDKKPKKNIRGKDNCCGEVQEMYEYLEELRAWCDLVWQKLWGPGGGSPPPPPPPWP